MTNNSVKTDLKCVFIFISQDYVPFVCMEWAGLKAVLQPASGGRWFVVASPSGFQSSSCDVCLCCSGVSGAHVRTGTPEEAPGGHTQHLPEHTRPAGQVTTPSRTTTPAPSVQLVDQLRALRSNWTTADRCPLVGSTMTRTVCVSTCRGRRPHTQRWCDTCQIHFSGDVINHRRTPQHKVRC